MVLVRKSPSCLHNRLRCRYCVRCRPSLSFCHTSTTSDTQKVKQATRYLHKTLAMQKAEKWWILFSLWYMLLSTSLPCTRKVQHTSWHGRSLECDLPTNVNANVDGSIYLSHISTADLFQGFPCNLLFFKKNVLMNPRYTAYLLTAIRCHILRPWSSCIASFAMRRSVCSI